MLPLYACSVCVAVARVKILFLLAAALSFMEDSVTQICLQLAAGRATCARFRIILQDIGYRWPQLIRCPHATPVFEKLMY